LHLHVKCIAILFSLNEAFQARRPWKLNHFYKTIVWIKFEDEIALDFFKFNTATIMHLSCVYFVFRSRFTSQDIPRWLYWEPCDWWKRSSRPYGHHQWSCGTTLRTNWRILRSCVLNTLLNLVDCSLLIFLIVLCLQSEP